MALRRARGGRKKSQNHRLGKNELDAIEVFRVYGDAQRIALRWFLVGSTLALLYLTVVFRLHRRTAVAAAEGEGY